MKLPVLGSAVKTVALLNELFDCVPIPRISEPVTEGAPAADTAGSSITVPLLSEGIADTGF